MRFHDRAEAGRRLADRVAAELHALGHQDADVPAIVLALPRGGVPVAVEVAVRLGAELDVYVVRKLGAPSHPEYGIGALAEDGPPLVEPGAVRRSLARPEQIARVIDVERAEMARRVRLYRGDRPLPDLRDRDVVVVDDGLATGVTALAAVQGLRGRSPRRVIMAVPVASPSAVRRVAMAADRVVCLHTPHRFDAVGLWYDRFDQLTDDEVVRLLASTRSGP